MRKKTNMKKVLVVFASFFTITLLIIVAIAYSTSNYIKKIAYSNELPTDEIQLENKMNTYHSLYNNSNIYRIHWGFTEPIHKIKENNPYNDYWIIDENQSAIVDVYACVPTSDGKIYVDDISKIPRNYHSDKVSNVSLYCGETIYLNLTNDEVLALEKLVFNENIERLNITNFCLNDKNLWQLYEIRFHIKELEGLYYSDGKLAKSIDGNYYITQDYAYAYAEIPKEIGEKIDIAFQQANMEFEKTG